MQLSKTSTKIKYHEVAEIACVTYYANATIRFVFQTLFGSSRAVSVLAMLIPFFFVCICLAMNYRRAFKLDFAVLYALVLAFFAVTVLIHPDYAPFYLREDYGVWDHVLSPRRGIYAYLFIRLLDDPNQFKKCYKTSGWILYPHFIYRIIVATRRGYWEGWAMGVQHSVEMKYSVSLGYEILPFVLFFLWDALSERKVLDIVGTTVGSAMILIAGSRGPFLFIFELIIIFLILRINRSRKKAAIILAVVATGTLLFAYGTTILIAISNLLARFGFSSRILKSLIAGTVANDNGRNVIWKTALELIKENPFGYGAMGARKWISPIIYVGYPHSIFFEFLIDYGVFLGGALFVGLMLASLRLIFHSDNTWKAVFIPMFCTACGLFISLTYWSVPSYWSCLAIGYQAFLAKKRITRTAKKERLL